jgi:nucleoid DNA-binding protein
MGIVDTKELAGAVQQNVSVKKSDVYAVLMELADAVRDGITKKRAVSLLKGIKAQSAPEYSLPADTTYNP